MGSMSVDSVEVGWSVRLTLSSDKSVSGSVYTIDPVTKTIVLFGETEGEGRDVDLVPSHAVRDVEVLEKKSTESKPLDPKQLAKREEEAYVAMERAMMALNPKATPEGQAIFDGLNKTMDCTWIENSINVLDQVKIDPPYAPENCHTIDGNQKSLDRIKRVLVGIKKRITKTKNAANRQSQPPPNLAHPSASSSSQQQND